MSRPQAGRAPRMPVTQALTLAILLASALLAAQSSGPQQPVPFRTTANFVRVDVYPTTKDGRHVGDLTAADFEVFEDRVAQRIATFEHIVVQGAGSVPAAGRVDPRSPREEQEEARGRRGRLFVVFFDTAHVTDPTRHLHDAPPPPGAPPQPPRTRMGPPPPVDEALRTFLDRMLAPDDMVAVMTPSMRARDIVFVRRPSSFDEFLEHEWAQRSQIDLANEDDVSRARCGWPPEVTLKRQEERTIGAARDLVAYLGTLREERKSVLLVTEGWMLFGRNSAPAQGPRPGGTGGLPAPPGVLVGPDGRARIGRDERELVNRLASCDAEAARLAQVDSERGFRDLLEEANRSNTTFYPIDPRGLAAADASNVVPRGKDPAVDDFSDLYRTLGYTEEQIRDLGTMFLSQSSLRVRLETLRTLANVTDGLMTLSNDLGSVVQKIGDDLSAYYLIGYTSTRTKPDGLFHGITVRVKRPGVQVRARRGYRAPTRKEAEAASAPPPVAEDAELSAVRNSIANLQRIRDDVPFAAETGQGCTSTEGAPPNAAVWVAGEVTPAGVRDTGWQAGAVADITLTDPQGKPLGSQRVELALSKRTFLLTLPSAPGAGEHTVRVVVQPAAPTSTPFSHTLRIAIAQASEVCIGTARLRRRGPFSGPAEVPTVDQRFRRQERAVLEVPAAGAVQAVGAQLLDRNGKPLTVPMRLSERQDGASKWITAEATLAPLAPGDYVMALDLQSGGARRKVLKAIRIVP